MTTIRCWFSNRSFSTARKEWWSREDFELLIPLGEAELKREGSDVTIICYAQTVPLALAAAETLENDEEISAEVLDLRSIKPLDLEAILKSVSKTHRVVIVEQDRPFCGVGAEVCYRIQKEIFDELDAPIMRVAQEDVPMPYNERLEKAVLPSAGKMIAAVKKFVTPNDLIAMPEIQMPKLSDTMTEGTLVAWKKKKGDKVSAGDVIAEIETDKATMEWESPEDGTLTEIYVEEGGKVNVGDKIAFIGAKAKTAPGQEAQRKKSRSDGRSKAAEKKGAGRNGERNLGPATPQERKKSAPPPRTKSRGVEPCA